MGKVLIQNIVDAIKLALIKKYNSEIYDFGVVNFDKLENWCEIIRYEQCYLLVGENPVVASMYSSLCSGGNVDEEIFIDHNYLCIYEELVKKEILKLHIKKYVKMRGPQGKNGRIQIKPRIDDTVIISRKKFTKYQLDVRKCVIILSLYKWLIGFIESKLEDISRSGSFSADRINEIKKSLDNSSHRLKNVANQKKVASEQLELPMKPKVKNKVTFLGQLRTFYVKEKGEDP